MRTLLLGLGNPLLTDDTVGIRLVRDFSRKSGAIPGLEIVEECTTGGLDLLPVIEGCDRLLMLDSIQTRGGVPGNWFRFTAEKLRETIHLVGIHDANFATVLSMGRQLGMKLPADEEIHIFAVEVFDNFTFGERMTDRLETAYPVYSEEIFREIEALLRVPY